MASAQLAACVLAVITAIAAVAVTLFRCGGRRGAAWFAIGALALGLGLPGALLVRAAREPSHPRDLTSVEYRQSPRCDKCHADHVASWNRTFHRTMTQEASPATVLGDFDDVTLHFLGYTSRLFRQGDAFFMDLIDLEWERATLAAGQQPTLAIDPPRRSYRVDRLVGSNQMQVYLTRVADGSFVTLPLEWNNRLRRWVASPDNYMQPPADSPALFGNSSVWNRTCVFCHNTRPNPGVQTMAEFRRSGVGYRTQLAEMGIACEACHGPGQLHQQVNHDPVRRHLRAGTDDPDPTIVNPARLPQQASVEVCGRCHGKWGVRSELATTALRHGDFFVPGQQPLSERYEDPSLNAGGAYTAALAGYFWPDWTPRPTAMEYQGTVASPCFQRGSMTCLSCHSMHDADPVDQLRHPEVDDTPAHEGNESCLQCHASYRDDAALAAHSHHPAASTASQCVQCHMPYAAFGLMKAVRTHRIVSPDAHVTAQARLPNGCNQCHVDRTLGWTAEWLARWYGQPPLERLGDDRDTLALTVVDLLEGHALSRALAAFALGWGPAQAAAPGDWRVPLLLTALDDDYTAVRYTAEVALRELEGFDALPFTAVDAPGTTAAARAQLLHQWFLQHPPQGGELPAALALQAGGLAQATVARLRERQDRTPLTILE